MGPLDPDAVRARWLELQRPEAVRALRESREAAVESIAWMSRGSEDHWPEPHWQQQLGRTPGRSLSGPAPDATRLGLDSDGRVVLAEMSGRLWHFISRSRNRIEAVRVRGEAVEELAVLAFEGERPTERVACEGSERLDGRPAVKVTRYVPDPAGRVRVAVRVFESGSDPSWKLELGPYWGSTATRFQYDDSGELLLVEHVVGPSPIARGRDHHAALAEALTGLEQDGDDVSVVWDGRLQRREDDLPAPEAALEGLAAPLADAIFAATKAVEEAVTPLAFVDVRVSSYFDRERPRLPDAAAASVEFRDRAREVAAPREVLELAHRGGEGAAELDVVSAASGELLRRFRAAAQVLADDYTTARQAGSGFARELARELDLRAWPQADPAFLAVVHSDDDRDHEWLEPDADDEWLDEDDRQTVEGDEDAAGGVHIVFGTFEQVPPEVRAAIELVDQLAAEGREPTAEERDVLVTAGWDIDALHDEGDDETFEDVDELPGRKPVRLPTMREVVGDERVDALSASLAAPAASQVAVPDEDVCAGDRAELAAHLERAGLSADVAQRVADDAAWAIVLEPDPAAESRLGGPAIVPEDMPWPTADGRPLTHLATIALAELPDVEGRDVLPRDGHLAFFADLSEAGEFYEPLEPGQPGRELAAVIHTPADVRRREEAPAEPPGRSEYDPPIVLNERRVRPTARLQLRDVGFGLAQRLFAVDAVGEHVLERLHEVMNGAIDHQLLGFPRVVQDDPREPGQVALFHIAHDPQLGLEFLDAGDLLFFGDADDIRACRWERLTVWPSSC